MKCPRCTVPFHEGQWDVDHDMQKEMRLYSVYCHCGKEIPLEQYGEHARFCKMHQHGLVDEFEKDLRKGMTTEKIAKIKENLSNSPRSG